MIHSSNYFEVIVILEEEVDTKKGVKIRKYTERYLVEADSITYAEAAAVNYLKDTGSSMEYFIKSVKESSIRDVIRFKK